MTLKLLVRSVCAALLIVLQQAILLALGLIAAEFSFLVAVIIFALCLPMIYINKLTWQYVRKYGVINFYTMNADTSEIDVPKGNRWYDDP